MFTANYPFHEMGKLNLLPTPERIGAVPEYTGHGVTIAVIDSGFYPHPEIADRVVLHVDASSNHVVETRSRDYESGDLGWHGLMTSVIAAGDGRLSDGRYRGLASAASLVLVRVATPKGLLKETDILRGLRWVIDAHRRLNIRVVNLSVGGDYPSADPDHPLHRAVRRLAADGVAVVAASGNRLADVVLPPASAPEAIVVGGYDDNNSLDRSQWRPYQSNYGVAHDGCRKPDLLAPAMWVAGPIMPKTMVAREARWLGQLLYSENDNHRRSLLERGCGDLGIERARALNPDDNLYAMIQARINTHKIVDVHHQHVDGTSVATAVVTSVVAQMLEANPNLTPDAIRSMLTATAEPLPDVPVERQGAGVMNASAAVYGVTAIS